MRILLVNKFLYLNGGSESYMFSLANFLREKGNSVEFFGMQNDKNIENSKYNVRNVDFKKGSISNTINPLKLIYSVEAKRNLERYILDFKPDIIHLNNYNYQLTPSIIYAAKKYGIPVIQTVHDTNVVCPYHRLYNYKEQSICEKCKGRKYYNCLKTKCIDNSFLKSLIGTSESYLYKFLKTYDYIKYFICPSQFMNDKLQEFGIDGSKNVTISNFIDSNKLSNLNKNINEKPYVLYFGRVSSEKGVKDLVKAAKLIPEIQIKICGTGPMVEELISYISHNQMKNVELLGFKSGDELVDTIKNAKASIVPSLCYDNCPMSIIESKACGVPVIGSKIGGIPELIRDGTDGYLYEPGDYEALANKIKNLIENKELLEMFSNNSIIDYKERFTVEKYYEQLIKIYNKCLN